ncbi:N-acetyltransferase [Methanolobus profundi]|uniref:Putative acetyltransferase n=1 Tax=Methanolobus profundi TaxID=487685 RepID=A0A1I4NT70_9EURY|nr:N-acetyltransferase [Methanolobus profundi]SFM18333.1 putative acetyltransferase [Methanolobus profundi]
MIRELESFEVDTIMDIWLKTNIRAHSFIPEKYWLDNYNVVKEEYLPMSETFVYVEDDVIRGFIGVIDDHFIGALFVMEEYQGKGVGRRLLDHCKSLCSDLELGVYSENKMAIRFYTKNGFRVKKEQPNEDSGFMEYLMSWKKE